MARRRGDDEDVGNSNNVGIVVSILALVFMLAAGWRHDALGHPTVKAAIAALVLVLGYVLIVSQCRRRQEAREAAAAAEDTKQAAALAAKSQFHVPLAIKPDPVFSRAEVGTQDVAGSVKHYATHIFVVGGNPQTWPAQVKTPVIERLNEGKSRAGRPIRITACFPFWTHAAVSKLNDQNAALLFPARVGYRSVDPTTADRIIDEHIAAGKLVSAARPVPLDWDSFFVFVCCHQARDVRCGACGPQLLEQFKACLQGSEYKDRVHLYGCSHVGGHKFAGNVITFGRRRQCGQTLGDWYGYVTPDRCADILSALVGGNAPVMDLWRGQMGLSPAEHKARVQGAAGNAVDATAGGLRQRRGGAGAGGAGAGAGATTADDGSCGPGCLCVGDKANA